MAQLAARRYAKAIFELALENGKLDDYTDQLAFLHALFEKETALFKLMTHPDVDKEEKFTILRKAFAKQASEDILGLLQIIIKKNREKDMKDILATFLAMSKAHQNIVTAYVDAPRPLSEKELLSVKQILSRKLNKQVEIQFKLVPELIGGVRIIVDGKLIDGSIKKQLDDMKSKLLNLQLVQ